MGGQYASVEPTRLIDRQCSACANGTFLPPMSTVTACPSCDAGFADTDFDPATECAKCPPGTYQPGYQQPTVCPLCAPNHYDDDSDSTTACVPCAPGFSSVAGASTCVANVCKQSSLPQSTTICRGATTDECAYLCKEGYAPAGKYICAANGSFAGGRCEGVPCAHGAAIEHSPTDCNGVATGDTCEFTCEAGYYPTGSHKCLAMGWFQGGSCAPMPCEESRIPNSTRPCTGVMGDICTPECIDGFGSVREHRCQVTWQPPYPGAPAEISMIFLGGACEALPEPEPEPEPEPLPFAPPPSPPSPVELVLQASLTIAGGIVADLFLASMHTLASSSIAHVFGEDQSQLAASSWVNSEKLWSSSMRVAITHYRQTVSSWLTIASDGDGDGDAVQRDDFGTGSVERYSLQLALLSTFGVSTPSQVQIGKLTPAAAVGGRRRLWASYHINYTIVSSHDISSVATTANFAAAVADNMYTTAWSYGGVRLDKDGLITAPIVEPLVETIIDYELIASLDLALHDKSRVELALVDTADDHQLLSEVLNISVLRSSVTGSRTVDLSNRTRFLPPPAPHRARDGEAAAVAIGLLLVISAAASFGVLLYRVCVPAYKGWRVAPVSKYEFAPKEALGGGLGAVAKNPRRAKHKVGRQDKWWQEEAKRKEEEAKAKQEAAAKLATVDKENKGSFAEADGDDKADDGDAEVNGDAKVDKMDPSPASMRYDTPTEREAADFSAGFASDDSSTDGDVEGKAGKRLTP